MSENIMDTVVNTIKKHDMLNASDYVIIGLSGGTDSVALFSLLLKLRGKFGLTLSAVHVNHGIRGMEADEDERFCAELCEKNNVPIEIYRYNVKTISAERKISEEEAGRQVRYEAFYDTKKRLNAQKIAVAHNMNDQAETVLLRLFRGAGLKGLSGIPPMRDCIIRPLIDVSREEIEAYCTENELSFRHDSTNDLDCYSRNMVRGKLMPFITQYFNPSIERTLSQTAGIMRAENDYLNRLAQDAYEKCVLDNGESLDIGLLEPLDDVLKRRVIRIAYLKLNDSITDMEFNHVEKVLSLLYMQSGKKAVITDGIIAARYYNKLLLNYKEKTKLNFSYDLEPESEIFIQETGLHVTVSRDEIKTKINCNNMYTNCFCYDKIIYGLKLRTRLPNDKIHIFNVGTKKLKDYLIDKKIEPPKRDMLFYLADGENIMWIIGDKVSPFYKADEQCGNNIYVQLWEDIR